jgi:hypothetical protein
MAEQRFGIFGKDVTRYIPPGLRPFAKAAVEMNPVTGFQRAGQALKEGKYGESAMETGILALPAGAYALRNVIKPSVTAGVDALKELFLLGAADDVAKKTPAAKQGLSRREVLTGMGAAALAAPVGKGLVDLVPPAPVAKVAKVGLKGALGSAAAKAQKLRDLYFGANKVIKEGSSSPTGAVESLSQSMKIGEEMDSVTLSMNKDLDKVLKDAGDFSKFSDDELVAMAEMKLDISHMMRTGKGPDDFVRSGDPLRKEDVSKALDDAIDARGLRKQVRDLGLERMMQSIESKRSLKPSAGTLDIDLPSDIIPKMLPSGQATKSIFAPEAKKGRQLLIVSCGDKKCPDVGNMKALDRYLGPIFTSIRKAGVPENVDVAILSAKHGLIRADAPIENYNQLMTKDKVSDFISNPNEMSKIAETMRGYDNVLVQGGDNYKNVIKSAAGDIPFTEVPKGRGIGDQRSSVAKFLTEAAGGGSTTTKQDIDTLFEAMDEEGALLEFPELGKKLNRYTFNNDRDALIEAITDEDYPAYEAAMKGMLKRTFPSGKIPVRRVENYTELQLFGTKDPETLAMMEQAGLQKLKDQKKVVTEKLIDIDDVKFVGNPAEEELIILDTPRQFRKGAMIGDKQLLSYTINLPKKVEKKEKGGIAGLSDVARDMFKGPKGIGAYQPFMVG